MSKQKRWRGHFCWCCGRIRANERFSGAGHARHICRDCAKLGSAELRYRQQLRALERLIGAPGIVRRKHRKAFAAFLSHPDERVRRYAEEIAAADALEREAMRRDREAFEAAAEACLESRASKPGPYDGPGPDDEPQWAETW